jgi:uncharacterized protein (TIGR03790 family)
VVVIYNRNLTESKRVADHYVELRHVPGDHVFGLDLPSTETITRHEFENKLAKPLLRKLRDTKLFTYGSGRHASGQSASNEVPAQATIRYATLCYGVPLKILNDPNLSEDGTDKLRPELRRNDAAVDSELALLPILSPKPPLFGAVPNHFYGTTNAMLLNPTNGLLLVARLDGPTPEIARALVDKALQAEADGLWGRAYFDSRGITNGSYKVGDDWIRGGAEVTRVLGFETQLDKDPATFPASFPMSHIAIYAGWYDGNVSGPFTRPEVEFMPGAFAYHLHSFSAQTIRSITEHWVGPLLANGATITLGCVEEPYLEATPDIRTFLARFLFSGFTFGEAAYACQSNLSWQTTVVGDPLYQPFAREPSRPFEAAVLARHEDLLRRKSKLIEWSCLRLVNLQLSKGEPPDKAIGELELTRETYTSPILCEKLGDLYVLKAQWPEAIRYYRKALDHSPSPQQQVRLSIALARTLDFAGQMQEAFDAYDQFLKSRPDYPDRADIYRRMSLLAEQTGKEEDKQRCLREIERLNAASH